MGPLGQIKLFRIAGWEQRLAAYMATCQSRTFDRGTWDCARYVADALNTIVAVDLAKDFRYKYKTDAEARALVKSFGRDGFFRVVDEIFISCGFVPVDWKKAQRGDPVFVDGTSNEQWAGGLAICYGHEALSPALNKTGLAAVLMSNVRAAWHIPYTP